MTFRILFLLGMLSVIPMQAQVKSVSYAWKSVEITGGGFVPGIIFHPTEKNLKYCRTDMGGAYRWDESVKKWMPLLDWLTDVDRNLMGVESIAVDPNDPNMLYMACGTSTRSNGAILRSTDRGKTFQRINVPFKMGGNERGRGNGERMMVDPNNSNIVYMGTRINSLWRSTDKGLTWEQVQNFPDITEAVPEQAVNARPAFNTSGGSGIVFVAFDPASAQRGQASNTIFAGVSLRDRANLYCSKDAGKTWQEVAKHPQQYRPTHGIIDTQGNLVVSYGSEPGPNPSVMKDGGIWRYNIRSGVWTDITPEKPDPEKRPFGYAAVSVDQKNPNHMIASTFGRVGDTDDIFRTTDGGRTWKSVLLHNAVMDNSIAPYVSSVPLHWMFDVEIDPANPDHAMFVMGYGGWETFNLSDIDKHQPIRWTLMGRGIEETVPLELLSPPQGAHLLTAIGDYAGFAHWDLDDATKSTHFVRPYFGNTNGFDCAAKQPSHVVRVGISSGHHPSKPVGYSDDYGMTWTEVASVPERCQSGHIAVAADASAWVWAPNRAPVYYTTDRGITWIKCEGIPDNTRVIADKFNPKVFYGLAIFEGKLYTSTDGGKTFTAKEVNLTKELPKPGNRGDTRGGQDRVYAAPDKEGDLWIAAFDGLYHKNAKGVFEKKGHVQEIYGFGFGKAAPAVNYSAIYLAGIVDGVVGIFRSDDMAQNWVRINDDTHQYGSVFHVTGDPKKYGRVYIGTHGRGALYADPM